MDRWIGAIVSRVHTLALPPCFTPREGLTRSHFIDEAARAILILKSHFEEPDTRWQIRGAYTGSLARALDLEVGVLRSMVINEAGQIDPDRPVAMSTIGPLLSFAGSAATALNKWDAATTRIHSLLAWDPAVATTTDPGKLADLIGLHLQILEGKVSAGDEARAGLRHLLDAALEAIDGGDLEGAVALLGDADAYDPGEPDDDLEGDARVRRIAEDIAHAPAAARESSSIVDDLAALMRLYLAHTGATPTITDLVRVCRVGLEAEARVASGGGGEGPIDPAVTLLEPGVPGPLVPLWQAMTSRGAPAAALATTDLERAANLEDFRERMIYADKNRPRGLDIGDPRRDPAPLTGAERDHLQDLIIDRVEAVAREARADARNLSGPGPVALCLTPSEVGDFMGAHKRRGGGELYEPAPRHPLAPYLTNIKLHGGLWSGDVLHLDARPGVVVGGLAVGVFHGVLVVQGQP